MIDFPITYFGPISWYSRLLRTENWRIDDTEHYVKQTTRNHCLIATVNGVQKLTVPVEKPSRSENGALLTREVRLSDHGKWRTEHWNAICTAYGESPFFDYYADDLRPFFERRDWEFLFDYDMAIFDEMSILPSLSGEGKGVGLPTGKSIKRVTVFCPTSRFSTCSVAWDPKRFCGFEAVLTPLNC